MGNWNINIQGIGSHHNKDPKVDADLAAANFVKTLKSQGHIIQNATFTFGAYNDLLAQDVRTISLDDLE
jgi:hypothetical protein